MKDSKRPKSTSSSATHKGEEKPTTQKGAISVNKGDRPKNKKDESDGAAKNTTKKQGNSI